ncbi:MAG: hypothetical protein RIC55_34860 [Pirellulaceae bacterium]
MNEAHVVGDPHGAVEMHFVPPELPASGDVPQHHRAIVRAGQQVAAIRAERRDGGGMPGLKFDLGLYDVRRQ